MRVRTLLVTVGMVLVPLMAWSQLPLTEIELGFRTVVSGLTSPVGVESARDGSGRLFVVDQTGTVQIVRDGQMEATPFLDLSGSVSLGNEQGLLGLVFHPDYSANGQLFVNYTDLNGDTVIARFEVQANDPDQVDPLSETIILTIDQPYANHNAGDLAFGPDGLLYIPTGDGGFRDDPQNRAQDLGSWLGKILRIDVDSGTPYAVPSTNPFVGVSGAVPEIWAYGLRNPWRVSFDPANGDLYIADVGQNSREEINVHRSGSAAGTNYGWRCREGTLDYITDPPCTGTLTDPVFEYTHDAGNCSVTGGRVYRGLETPRLDGVYLLADYCSGKLWGLAPDDAAGWSSTELVDTTRRPVAFGEDGNGELYMTDIASGELVRVFGTVALPSPGDANGDGQLNLGDAVVLIRATTTTFEPFGNADCSDDSTVSTADLTCVLDLLYAHP